MASIALGDAAKCTPSADYEDLTPGAQAGASAGGIVVYWSDESTIVETIASLQRAREFVIQYFNQDD